MTARAMRSASGRVPAGMRCLRAAVAALALAIPVAQARADPQPTGPGTVTEAARRLRPGEYLWAPEIAPDGPVMVVVNRRTQRAIVYRGGLPIGITTVSTGRPGHTTPLGARRVLLRAVDHYSSIYRGARMPYMQRITTGGIALHGGELPGYPASHGCIRLPVEFARLLFGVTAIGTPVEIVDRPALAPLMLASDPARSAALLAPHLAPGPTQWRGGGSGAGTGTTIILVSAAQRRALVLRGGVLLGSGPVTLMRTPAQMLAYRYEGTPSGSRWAQLALAARPPAPAVEDVSAMLGLDPALQASLAGVLRPGSMLVLVPDALAG